MFQTTNQDLLTFFYAKEKTKNPFTKVSNSGPPVLLGPSEKDKPHNGHSATKKA